MPAAVAAQTVLYFPDKHILLGWRSGHAAELDRAPARSSHEPNRSLSSGKYRSSQLLAQMTGASNGLLPVPGTSRVIEVFRLKKWSVSLRN